MCSRISFQKSCKALSNGESNPACAIFSRWTLMEVSKSTAMCISPQRCHNGLVQFFGTEALAVTTGCNPASMSSKTLTRKSSMLLKQQKLSRRHKVSLRVTQASYRSICKRRYVQHQHDVQSATGSLLRLADCDVLFRC